MKKGKRQNRYSGFDVLAGGLLIALALVFPVIFHGLGLGSAFLPMFFPMMAAGFLITFPASVTVGVMSPLLSALLTGMPPFYPPLAFLMAAEGVVLTAAPALLHRRWKINPWVVVPLTLAVDRGLLYLAVISAARWLQLPEGVFSVAMLARGVPGIIALCLVMPPLVQVIRKRLSVMIGLGGEGDLS